MNLNKVFILGNLTRDPEIRSLPSGQSVASFGIATNRFWTTPNGEKKQEAEFHNIVAFGKLADIVSRYLNKGSLVLIEGRLRTRNWQDASNNKHSRTEIIAERMQMGPKNLSSQTVPQGENISHKSPGEEIPIIEEEEEHPENSSHHKLDKKNSPPEEEEINVKDIPF